MKVAVEFEQIDKLFQFRALAIDEKHDYVPICQYLGTDKTKVINKGISSLKKLFKGQ
jgi:hypothetical protein